MKKMVLIIAAAAVLAACNQDGGRDVGTKTTHAPATVAKATPPAPEPAANMPATAPSKEAREKELCNACDLDCSSHSVEEVYDVADASGKKQTLVAFSESAGGPNASYEVYLVTEKACRHLLSESGTSIGFVMMPNTKRFPDISVSAHQSAEESDETSYRWNGKAYVARSSPEASRE